MLAYVGYYCGPFELNKFPLIQSQAKDAKEQELRSSIKAAEAELQTVQADTSSLNESKAQAEAQSAQLSAELTSLKVSAAYIASYTWF